MVDEMALADLLKAEIPELVRKAEALGVRIAVAVTCNWNTDHGMPAIATGIHSYASDHQLFALLEGLNTQIGRFMDNRLRALPEDVTGPDETADSTANVEKIVVN